MNLLQFISIQQQKLISCRIDNWINEGSGWVVELAESQYINNSTYRPLLGSSYVKLPTKLRIPKKGLSNIKDNDQKCFLWCHVRHINPIKLMELDFLCEKRILARLKRRAIFVLMCFAMKTS